MNLPSRGSRDALRRAWLRPLWLLLAALPGCVPGHYRRQADRDAYELVGEHVSEPQAALEHFSVYPDPRSRMFDPFDPDHEPLPPDDPQSHRLMHRDGKEGYRHWHRHGDTSATENPDWQSCLPLDEQGVLVLDQRRTMELALLHSRDYQLQWEELYLSALDVSFERFRFDTLFFGGYQLDYLADGRLRNGGGNFQSLLTASTFPNFRLEKLGTSGTDLLVSFANSLVWQFSGPDDYSTSTLLDLTLIQPLLRRGGTIGYWSS